jgi:transposase
VREAASRPGSSSLGLKRSQAQQGEPMRMARAGHQFPWAFAVALRTSAAQEAPMVQEERKRRGGDIWQVTCVPCFELRMDTLVPELADEAEDARKIGHKSARRPRVEALSRADRRRSWTAEQKREIVGESLGPELTPSEVARKHGISTGQLYTWRQQMVSFQGAVVSRTGPRFTAVNLAPAPPSTTDPAPAAPTAPSVPTAPERAAGLIEILLPGGVSLRVDAQVDGRALRRVLGALEGR